MGGAAHWLPLRRVSAFSDMKSAGLSGSWLTPGLLIADAAGASEAAAASSSAASATEEEGAKEISSSEVAVSRLSDICTLALCFSLPRAGALRLWPRGGAHEPRGETQVAHTELLIRLLRA